MTEQPTVPDHDDEDVPAALLRMTWDGSGTVNIDDLPPGDFESFAMDDVEVEDE